MRIKSGQLPQQLDKSLAPVYLIGGAEPLLVQECRDQVLHAAKEEGFVERDTFQTDSRFDWGEVHQASATPSLFASRRILDIRLPTARPGQEGAKQLSALAGADDPDTLLLVSAGEWSKAIGATKWVETFSKIGVVVEIWPIKPHELPGWINARLKRAGLDAEPDAVERLAQLVEGNLLAAQQEIDKLVLSDVQDRLTVDDIDDWVANSSRFDPFRLIECTELGRLGDSLRVASGLKRTGVAIQAIVAVWRNEIELLAAALTSAVGGESQAHFFRRMRIWQARQVPIRAALSRLGAEELDLASVALALIDRQGKGMAPGDPWQSLDQMLCLLCGRKAAELR